MSQPQVSVDGRSRAEKLSRRQALDICAKRGHPVPNENIPLGTGIPMQDKGPTILKWMETHGIDWNDPFPEVGWQRLESTDETGKTVATDMPVRPPHESASLHIDYDKEIAAAAAKHEEQQGVIEDQNDVIKSLLSRLEVLEKSTIPISKATIPQLKGIAKARGVDLKDAKGKKEILELLGE